MPTHFNQLLINAVQNGNASALQALIETGVDINITHRGWSLLNIAVDHNNIEIVQLLIKADLDVNVTDQGWSPLRLAVDHGNIQIVQLLIEAGALVNEFGPHKHSVLYVAMTYGHENEYAKIIRLLIEAGALVNELDHQYRLSLLYHAINLHQPEIILRYLTVGGALTYCDNDPHQDRFNNIINAELSKRMKSLRETLQTTITQRWQVTLSSPNTVPRLLRSLLYSVAFSKIMKEKELTQSPSSEEIEQYLLISTDGKEEIIHEMEKRNIYRLIIRYFKNEVQRFSDQTGLSTLLSIKMPNEIITLIRKILLGAVFIDILINFSKCESSTIHQLFYECQDGHYGKDFLQTLFTHAGSDPLVESTSKSLISRSAF